MLRLEHIPDHCNNCCLCELVFPGILKRLEAGPVTIGLNELDDALRAKRACLGGALIMEERD